GSARVNLGLFPLQLIKRLNGDIGGDAQGGVYHVDGQQNVLDLGTRCTQSGNVGGVNGVDPPLDEGTLPPAHHLAAQSGVQGHIANFKVAIDIGIHQFDVSTRLIQGFFIQWTGDAIVILGTSFVHQLKVIEITAADESTIVIV